MPKPKSKAQAALFGYIAGGGDHRFEKFPAAEARERLRGTKIGKLPERIGQKKKKKKMNPFMQGYTKKK